MSLEQTTMARTRHAEWIAALAAFLWPFLFLFPYVVTSRRVFLSIGNDFYVLYYTYKAYLLDSLVNFDIPWWSPSEAAGFPFYASPFSETFYPLNVPLAVYYELVDGYDVIDHQRFTVLGVAIFTLGLLRWLRALRFEVRTALAVAMVMGVSFKVTELMRFPNALHTAAWYPWVLLCMTRLAGSTSTRSRVANATLLAAALICMITGGYPYYVIYSPWLFGPYLLVLLVPRWSRALLEREAPELKRVLPALAIAGLAVVLVCGPFLYKMSALMQQTTDRAGKSFEYSTQHVFDVTDTIGSWVFPPASPIEGWYYFGIINVMLVLLAVVRRPRNPVTLFLLAWIAIVTYITYGKSSYLFVFLWNYVPPYSSLRVWGRMNIILVPILAWLVAVAYREFESLAAKPDRNWRPLAWVGVFAGAILTVQFVLRDPRWHDYYWTHYYVGRLAEKETLAALLESLRWWGVKTQMTVARMAAVAEDSFIVATVVSSFAIASMLVLASRFRRARAWWPRATVTATVVIAALDLWVVGPWAWALAPATLWPRAPYQVAKRNAELFNTPRTPQTALYPRGRFGVGVMDNWYFQRYVTLLQRGQREPEALKRLLGEVDGRRIFFSERIDHASIQAFLDDADRFSGVSRVTSYTGDEITIDVRAPAAGYVSFIDNWDPDWTGAVDKTPVTIERLFGTFKSVPIRAGQHTVDFAYRPFGSLLP